MTSKVKTKARFKLSGPIYLLVPFLENEIGLMDPKS